MIVRSFLLCLSVCALSGCSGGSEKDGDGGMTLEEVSPEAEELLVEARGQLEAEVAKRAEREAEFKETEKQLETLVHLQTRKIAKLEKEILELRRELERRDTPQKAMNPAPAVSVPNVVETSARRSEEVFPVAASNIRGERVVTGTHTSERSVDTGEVYKDRYGNKVRKMAWSDREFNQYGYQVVFDLENQTHDSQEISVRAGLSTRRFIVGGRDAKTGITIEAAKGSGLLIMVGGRSERYEVTYGD